MALTRGELEAKVEALEDRIALLSQGTDTLEARLDRWSEGWNRWAAELLHDLAAFSKRLEHLRKSLPPPPSG